MTQFYQGDVALIALKKEELPKDLIFKLLPKEGQIVAYGEVTGHTHTIIAERESIVEMAQDQNGFYFVVKNAPAKIKHQEHKEIIINPGIWFVGQQWEYDEVTELKKVQD